jgi:hypothetical protein
VYEGFVTVPTCTVGLGDVPQKTKYRAIDKPPGGRVSLQLTLIFVAEVAVISSPVGALGTGGVVAEAGSEGSDWLPPPESLAWTS